MDERSLKNLAGEIKKMPMWIWLLLGFTVLPIGIILFLIVLFYGNEEECDDEEYDEEG